MKTLIVYFSLGGNTKWIAERIQVRLPNVTLHEIELAKQPLKGRFLQTMIYGFKTTFYRKMAIKNSNIDLAEYDAVIIGSPIWMGNVPPPVKAFINQYPLMDKKVAVFCSMGGEPSRFFHKLRELVGVNLFAATLAIVEPLENLTEANFENINNFINEVDKVFRLKKEAV